MSTLVLTLAINLPPHQGLAELSSAVDDAAVDAREHARKCDCASPFICEEAAENLTSLALALGEELARNGHSLE